MKTTLLSLAAGAGLLLSSPIHAEEEHRQLGTHMHGHGTLNLAIEGKKIAMELVVPGMDIVGFENKATTDEQKSLVKAAIKTLEKEPMKLFALSGEAGCTFSKASAELGGDDHEDHHDKDHHDHDKDAKHGAGKEVHDDKDHHDHDKDAKHDAVKEAHDGHDHDDHKKDEAHEDGATHNEFRAKYELECTAPQSLKEIKFLFFKQFPKSEELAVTIIDDKGAKSHKATPGKPLVKLGR